VHSGFFAALTPKPVLVLVALMLTVAATGAARPAYRALAPALLATAARCSRSASWRWPWPPGGAAGRRHAGPAGLRGERLQLEVPLALPDRRLLLVAGGVYLLLRPPRAGVVEPAGPGRARWSLGGAVDGRRRRAAARHEHPRVVRAVGLHRQSAHDDVSPFYGIFYNGGALSWYAGFGFGLLMMVGPWLLAGAALHTVVAGNEGLRAVARWLVVAAGALLIALVLLERTFYSGGGSLIRELTDPTGA
jgi:hypothetical protein